MKVEIPDHWLPVLRNFLCEYADTLGDNVSNDKSWPEDWTVAEKIDFVTAFHRINRSSARNADHDLLEIEQWLYHPLVGSPPDFAWVRIMIALLDSDPRVSGAEEPETGVQEQSESAPLLAAPVTADKRVWY